jgi:hypothetical protein
VVGFDLLDPLPETVKDNKYILVITAYLTLWPEAFAIEDTKAGKVARILVHDIICRHSAPNTLLSDQGTQIMSDLLKKACDYMKIK